MRATDARPAERGQVLAVFALSLMVMISITGLSIDAGGTFAQRRDQQSSADLAALAAANDYLVNGNLAQAVARGRTVTAANGFTHGVGGTTVSVTIATTNGIVATVQIGSAHGNTFLGAVGFPTWPITTSAAAIAGFPDTGVGVGPFIFSIGAFANDGTPKYQTNTDFGETNGDVPTTEKDIAWTNYGTGNVDTSQVSDIISGDLQINKTLDYG